MRSPTAGLLLKIWVTQSVYIPLKGILIEWSPGLAVIKRVLPCHICKDEPEGEADLLLFFTDHFLPQGLLKLLGEDLTKLKKLESNENLVTQAFLLNSKQYFSEDIQEAIVSEGDITEVEELLKKANLPVHAVEEIVVHEKSSKSIFILIVLALFSLTIYLAVKVIIKLFN